MCLWFIVFGGCGVLNLARSFIWRAQRKTTGVWKLALLASKSNICFARLFFLFFVLVFSSSVRNGTIKGYVFIYCAALPLTCLPSTNRSAIKLFLRRSTILQLWCDLQTVAQTSDLCVSIKPPFRTHVHVHAAPSLTHQLVLIFHPRGSTQGLLLLRRLTLVFFFLLIYLFLGALRDVLIISSKNTISVYSTEQKKSNSRGLNWIVLYWSGEQ